jgi:hypothetical protein
MHSSENNSIQIGTFINQPKELSVYLEALDGFGFEGKAVIAKIDMNTEFHFDRIVEQEWDITLAGIGSFTFTKGVDMAKKIAKRFLPQEWVCKFCGRANPVDQYQCQSCGWYRGIIADVVQEMGIWRPR